MSFRVMVKVRGETALVGNALFFPTKKGAEDYASDLCSRWTMCEKTEVKKAAKKANYRFQDGKLDKIGG